ncbi:hypothetical protein NDU88_003435 [Pleurodeles waltl]|uniref:Uncharacterized protein n=1 Tax=Pleurodeles waltl TaxID=8319 RepID=A0AAV7TNL5_PLEWA|nr:hypothetical protein NDU88_003435 [Pleurodeles waltl]
MWGARSSFFLVGANNLQGDSPLRGVLGRSEPRPGAQERSIRAPPSICFAVRCPQRCSQPSRDLSATGRGIGATPGCDRVCSSTLSRLCRYVARRSLAPPLTGLLWGKQEVRRCWGVTQAGGIFVVAGGLIPQLLCFASAERALGRGRHFTSRRPRRKHTDFSRFSGQNFIGVGSFLVLQFSGVGAVDRRYRWTLFTVFTQAGPRSRPRSVALIVQLHRLQATPPLTKPFVPSFFTRFRLSSSACVVFSNSTS